MANDLKKLLTIIEEKLGWGAADSWQVKHFEILSNRILEDTGILLSADVLRRTWMNASHHGIQKNSTLNALAMFSGYPDWKSFRIRNPSEEVTLPADRRASLIAGKKNPFAVTAVSMMLIIICLAILRLFYMEMPANLIKPDDYRFSSHKVTRQIPNPVVFNYDASASPSDSIYIQQSWDPRTKDMVKKTLHEHSAVYYEPGFFQPKLIIGAQVVKEHPLLISTNGWLGLLAHAPVPVYLDSADFIFKDSIQLKVEEIVRRNISMEPSLPLVKFYNVGNFQPVSLRNFSFSAEIRNEYRAGISACQFAAVVLITDKAPVVIQLSDRTCASDLNLLSAGREVSGKNADLSGFGVDFSKWALVSCGSVSNGIQYFINNKLAFTCLPPDQETRIVGLGFVFQGSGAVRNIRLGNTNNPVFVAF